MAGSGWVWMWTARGREGECIEQDAVAGALYLDGTVLQLRRHEQGGCGSAGPGLWSGATRFRCAGVMSNDLLPYLAVALASCMTRQARQTGPMSQPQQTFRTCERPRRP